MRRLLTALPVVALLAATPARACTVDVSPLEFGIVELQRISRGTGRIVLECASTVVVEIALSGNTSGGLRSMVGPGGAVIRYLVASDSGFRRPWGDGGAAGQPVRVAVHAGQEARLTIYGVVPAQPSVPEGDYADQLVLTVTY